MSGLQSPHKRFWRDRRGAVAALVALSIFAVLGFGALAIDVANFFLAQHIVQASANAAALAGAAEIGTGGAPVTTATAYSSVTGARNFIGSELPIAMNSGYPQLSCATTWATKSGVACSQNYTTSTCATAPCSPAVNIITVAETATVPTFFGRVFGISSVPVGAAATASAAGSALTPYNVALVLDTTASMGSAPQGSAAQKACSGYNTAIACAVDGAQIMLGEFWPCASGLGSCGGAAPVDELSLFVFPPVTNSGQAATDVGCTDPQIATTYSGTVGISEAGSTTTFDLLPNPGGRGAWGMQVRSGGGVQSQDMSTQNSFDTGSPWAVATDAGTATSAATRSGSKLLTFPNGVVASSLAGLKIADTTNPSAIAAGTTVASVSTNSSTVTMSQNATGTGVAQGDLITFGTTIPAGTGPWPWWGSGTTISSTSPGNPGSAKLSGPPSGAGILKGDNIVAGPLYEVVPFANDYRISDASALNTSSNLVKITSSNRGRPCLGTPGGLGTYYADAIGAAQSALAAEQAARQAAGYAPGQNVIVFLSDGNATSTAAQMGPLKTITGECQAAVTAAQNAAKAGTTIYTIYYDDNGNSGTCPYDSGSYTGSAPNGACYTLQQMAVAPGKSTGSYVNDQPKLFYSIDGTSAPCKASASYTSIATIFQHIVATLTAPRLIPIGTS